MAIKGFPESGISTERLVLRPVELAHAEALLAYYTVNRDHLQRWEPSREAWFYSVGAQRLRIADMQSRMAGDQALNLLIFRQADDALIGMCNFANFVRGAFQACHLGFSLAAEAEGQGYMTEPLAAAIDYVFEHAGMHRVMANYRPENLRSGALLARLGFEIEGRARDYLLIDGAWRDHVLTAKVRMED